MLKEVQLYYLNRGDKFYYPEITGMRNLEVKIPSLGSCFIKGEYFDGEIWKPLSSNYSVSNGSYVIPIK